VGADHEAGKRASDFTAFITHAKGPGKIPAGATDDEIFKTLITTKEPKQVIEMIIDHKLETAD